MGAAVESAATGPPADRHEDSTVLWVRAQLLLSSYAPLFLILSFRFEGTTLRVVCGALAGLGFAYLIVVLTVVARVAEPRPYPVETVKDASGEVAGYLATYVLPLVTLPNPTRGDLVGYCILAVVVAAIFLRSDLAQINPTLYLFGWRVASVVVNGNERYLVCRRLPRPATEVEAVGVAGLLILRETKAHA